MLNKINKKLIATLLVVGLGTSCVGCSTSESQIGPDSKFEAIEPTKENLLDLGSKQTKAIKGVLERYQYEVQKRNESIENDEFNISVDENDLKEYGLSIGYEIASGDVDVEGTNVNFKIDYSSGLAKDGSPEYDCDFILIWPKDTEFSMDNYEHFPELVKAINGDDYNITALNKRITETLEKAKVNEGEFSSSVYTAVGSYDETLYASEYASSYYALRYSLGLRSSYKN